MAAGRLDSPLGKEKRQERVARFLLLAVLLAVPLAIAAYRSGDEVVALQAAMPERGGWQPGHVSARVGEPLHLRLTSVDVVHGFVVGVGPDGQKHNSQEVEVKPGQVTELTLTFDRPGMYTYMCTRWCGPNHWRMRGTIEVRGDEGGMEPISVEPPLYVELGLDIDAPHPPAVVPERVPDAATIQAPDDIDPNVFLEPDSYMTQSPAEVWLALRDAPELSHVDNSALWDVVAYIWRRNTSGEALALGESLYGQNCAACHGESGEGDGVYAETGTSAGGYAAVPATAFTDPALLGASNALLQGKILRGGMGTGMPSWGTIFSDEEIGALLAYLWTFQFPDETRGKAVPSQVGR